MLKFVISTATTSLQKILKVSLEGETSNFLARFFCVIVQYSAFFVDFSKVLPYTALLNSMKKSFSKLSLLGIELYIFFQRRWLFITMTLSVVRSFNINFTILFQISIVCDAFTFMFQNGNHLGNANVLLMSAHNLRKIW